MATPQKTVRALRKDAERNRRRVLEAARELFAEQGLEPQFNEIAHYAGVGVGTVYRRFATKDELLEAIFADGLDQLTRLGESALGQEDSWRGFAWFVEKLCEITATDRGLRQIAFSKSHCGKRVRASQDRLRLVVQQLVAHAQQDGHLRPELSATDVPIFCLLAGTVTEFAGHVNGDLWRRYVGMLLDGVRRRADRDGLASEAVNDEELDVAMETWQPAGPTSDRDQQL